MILETRGVTKRFGGLVAVNDVSVDIDAGEIFGLIGPNGAGKTTFLNVIAGVYRPDGGTIRFNGADIGGRTSERICKQGIARTFQISQLFPKISAFETVLMAAVFGNGAQVEDPEEWVREVLAFAEFAAPEDTLCAKLNTGQRKRLDLARALASKPKLLLLDEPGAGLTPAELSELMALIRKIRAMGITIIVVEHLMRMIMEICDRMAVLHYGKLIATGTPAEIADNQEVVDAYLGETYLL